jgi:hypothetical protein
MSAATIQSLRVVNRNVRATLARLQGEPNRSLAVAPAEFAGLIAELLRATNCLLHCDPHPPAEVEFEKEISEYRNTLEQLAKVLPSVSGRLLTEKARLEAARARLANAAAWAQASQKTL